VLLDALHRDDGAEPEHVTEHSALFEHVAFRAFERRDSRLDCLFDGDGQLGVGGPVRVHLPARPAGVDAAVGQQQPNEFLDEVRVAAGHLDGILDDVLGDVVAAHEQAAKHRLGVVEIEVAQLDAKMIGRALAPLGAADQHVRPRAGAQHHRRAP